MRACRALGSVGRSVCSPLSTLAGSGEGVSMGTVGGDESESVRE